MITVMRKLCLPGPHQEFPQSQRYPAGRTLMTTSRATYLSVMGLILCILINGSDSGQVTHCQSVVFGVLKELPYSLFPELDISKNESTIISRNT